MRKMDLSSRCKDKLAYFRIKELKDVLSQLGLAKQGKKQDLVDKILSALSDGQVSKAPGSSKKNTTEKEEIARIIDDTYRKMQIHIHGSNELTSKGQSSSDVNNGKLKEEEVSSLHLDVKVRCPCRSSLLMESMVKCESPRCHVWQHIGCVIVPDTPMEGIPPVPPQFYCEVCRLSRADPFWVTVAQPLQPTKLTASDYPTDGSKPMQKLEQTFQLTRADRDMLQKPEYDVQVWCILLNDKVPYRMQWPQFADLQVNGVPVRTTNRPGSQLLGANGRDDGPMITICTREGTNKISLSGCDARIFCLGVRIGRRRTVQQVLNLIPKEADGERFEDALARVCRCIGGGNATENADSDDDLEVVADSLTISLRCPMTASRIKIAGRFKPCAHIGCFDLESFVELNQRSRKWQCPICVKNYSLENIIIDPYFNRIAAMMRDCGEDVNEIDLKPDGCWRVRNERERQDLAQWHFPDGSLCGEMEVVEGDLDIPKQIKQGVSEGHSNLKLGVKKTFDGLFNKPEDMPSLSSGSRLLEFENCCPKIMPLSSSATGSGREGEDPSVNQDAGGHFDFSSNNGNELDSLRHNFGPTGRTGNKLPSASSQSADIIILSDSDSDDENLVSHAIYESGQAEAAALPLSGTHASYQGMSRNLCPGLFNGDTVDSMEPMWQLPSVTPAGSSLRLFGTDTNVAISSVAVQHNSVACSTSMNGFPVAPVANVGPATQVPGSVCRLTIDLNSDVVENPLGFSGGDTSLQISVPSLPAATAVQSVLRNRSDMSNENWISLRFGAGDGDGGSGHVESAVTNGVNSSSPTTSNNAVLCPSAPADNSVQKTPKRPISSGPFSFPRQPRSVRPRPFAIDSESDWLQKFSAADNKHQI